jgi:spore maturation protein CgeB
MSDQPVVMLIHPGAMFSTHDVYTGLKAGLEANGVKVSEMRLDAQLGFFGGIVDIGIANDVIQNPVNTFLLAGAEAIAQAVSVEPDAVIAVSGTNFHMQRAMQLRILAAQRRKPMIMAIYCTESPYFAVESKFASVYDVVFTNERTALERFPHNERVYYLPHAYNPAVHYPGAVERDKQCDAFFVGTGFDERKALFDGVDWTDIAFVKKGYLWDGTDEKANVINPLNVTGNEEVVGWYRSSKVNINHHRTTKTYGSGDHIGLADAESLGPRAYEIAACGGFQLCDDNRAELFDVFGSAAATYRHGNSHSLEVAIRDWLRYEGRREEFAQAQHEAIQPHSWDKRAAQVLDILLG